MKFVSFLINSVLLGVGLAMDAFSVSLANGLHQPFMARGQQVKIAGTFAFFQALMPLIGWLCVHTIMQMFEQFEKLIPWIALGLLLFIGGKMLLDGLKGNEEEQDLSNGTLVVQGIATSIDALSVGFTIASYSFVMALLAAFLIAVVTFIICMIGIKIGKKTGSHLSSKASILGGIILIAIGIEIFIQSF